ncbi:hypothetical protein [Gluconobacter oxydans]|uniref:Uncharacterized protein n=1 Tax=Gluconobacter oxydans TaxID=442 RepID=A0AB35ANM6_GLUOY|nr:hypothetical protein [Gluconobacter oxydans]MBF0856535.1 hypothetical protein [Gluconobacter oxydans]
MLIVLAEEHRKNFRALCKAAESLKVASEAGILDNKNQEYLIKFYGSEVGLKFLLNFNLKLPFKYEVSKGISCVEGYSHDLPRMIAALKIPATRVPEPPTKSLMCIGGYKAASGGQEFSLKAAHEAWRYGLMVDPADLVLLDAYFTAVLQYLNEEITA